MTSAGTLLQDRPPAVPDLVVGAGEVGRGAAVAAVGVESIESPPLQFGRLLVRQFVSPGELGGPLQRNDALKIPDAPQVRVTPRRAERLQPPFAPVVSFETAVGGFVAPACVWPASDTDITDVNATVPALATNVSIR